MSAPERKVALAAIVEKACAKPNGGLTEIEDRIGEYERRYELRSEHLVAELKAGHMRETEDVASWLMLISVRDRAR